jgi:hypothetical protein
MKPITCVLLLPGDGLERQWKKNAKDVFAPARKSSLYHFQITFLRDHGKLAQHKRSQDSFCTAPFSLKISGPTRTHLRRKTSNQKIIYERRQ